MIIQQSVALVTGASRGLGIEVARAFARRGASLVIVARGRDELEARARELRRETEVLALDAEVSQDAEQIIERVIARFGRIDILVNNASELGPSPMPALQDFVWQDLERVYRVNVFAPLHLTQLVVPGMRSRGRGLIINVSSDAGVEAYPGWGGYGSSKAALEHVSRTLAAELDGTGIRVCVVDPGDMNTEMHRLAEPGGDLSGLPGPEVAAPSFVQLAEEDELDFKRIQAQQFALAGG